MAARVRGVLTALIGDVYLECTSCNVTWLRFLRHVFCRHTLFHLFTPICLLPSRGHSSVIPLRISMSCRCSSCNVLRACHRVPTMKLVLRAYQRHPSLGSRRDSKTPHQPSKQITLRGRQARGVQGLGWRGAHRRRKRSVERSCRNRQPPCQS